MTYPRNQPPIGVFDSGVGGLSVLTEIKRRYPSENIIYIADQKNVPYGLKTLDEVRNLSISITNYLLKQGAKLIVVACNTASAAALEYLRDKYPKTPFVGMEPAVKPAVEKTKSGIVGVLATPATFEGTLYASVVERFANGVELLQDTCKGLVQQIEKGNISGEEIYNILNKSLIPMIEKGADTIVLGCTHYPFVIPIIQSIVGEQVRVINPSPAVARQVGRLLDKYSLNIKSKKRGELLLLTTGNLLDFNKFLVSLKLEGEKISWGNDIFEA